jgi:hypothetical protein
MFDKNANTFLNFLCLYYYLVVPIDINRRKTDPQIAPVKAL